MCQDSGSIGINPDAGISPDRTFKHECVVFRRNTSSLYPDAGIPGCAFRCNMGENPVASGFIPGAFAISCPNVLIRYGQAFPKHRAILAVVKFLVIQTAFIGDVILATAVLEKLHRHYPDAQIDFLIQKGNESLLVEHPFLHTVHVFDKKQGKLQSMWNVIKLVRKEQYDVVINLHRFLSSGVMTVLSGAKKTIGFDKNPLSRFFSSRIKHEISVNGTLHEVQRNLLLISSLTDNDLSTRPRLYPSNDAYLKVKRSEEYICIAPASIWFTKQWPVAKWIEMIDAFADRYLVLLLGSKQDKGLCTQIKDAAKATRIEILAGELTLLESAALMRNARMNYVNDSAPLHLASAVNAPVTVVFCSTVPAFGFGPLSDTSFVVETSHVLDCRPCGLHGHQACPRGHFRCADIAVSQMIEKISLR